MMKDLSLFLLKNAFGAKMKRGFHNICTGESSTSTRDQQKSDHGGGGGGVSAVADPPPSRESQPTLEEMIFRLEMEERMDSGAVPHRMSCVNSSDILRSARNALNQYPRFSLDGKDAMYRSSFKNMMTPVSAEEFVVEMEAEKRRRSLPAFFAGERVIWCKPGVVAKLMGLESMPVPLNNGYRRERLSAILLRQNLRRRNDMREMERRRRGGMVMGSSCSRSGCCVRKKKTVEFLQNGEMGWPMRRFS